MQPDVEQLRTFVRAVFKHAAPNNIVSLRAFPQGRAGRPIFVRPFEIEADDNLESIIGGAMAGAREASKRNAVFSPPIASFRDVGKASEADLVEGFAISVECDAFPQTALAKLLEVIGRPTLVVASGGQWTDPETGEVQDKLHLHWVLTRPASKTADLIKLKQARAYATAIAGADPSCIPVNHPLRWPGSWHLKDPNNPRLCRIIHHNEIEVDLDAALEALRAAAPPEATKVAVTTTVRRAKARPRDRRWVLEPPVSVSELASAMRAIPNDGAEWSDWKNMALRIYAATEGNYSGFEIFDTWSKSSLKYDAVNTRAEWENIHRSPPNRTGAQKLFAIAREHGWRTETEASPSSKIIERSPTRASTKRQIALPHRDAVVRIEDEIRFFVDNVVINGERNPYIDFYIEGKTGSRDSPRSWAIVGPPGTFKSSIARKLVAERLKSGKLQKVVFLVPRLKFAAEYVAEFARLGIKAEVLRGRSARDDAGQKMCWDLARVAIAETCGIKVSDHVCKECPHLGLCPYTLQMEIESQVWIAASNYIFHDQKVLKGADCIVIDEGFHSRGIIDDLERHAIPLDALALQTRHRLNLIPQQLLRRTLYDVLQRQADDGGVEQGAIGEAFGDFWEGSIVGSTDELKRAELVERKVLDNVLLPQLKRLLAFGTGRGLQKLMRSELVRDIRHTQTMIKVWRELRDFVDMVSWDKSDDKIRSGRVLRESNKQDDGLSRFLVWRGISRITDQFQVPTLLLNVEHEEKIIGFFIPQIESPVVIDVAMPEATRIVQVLGAPTTKTKLGDPDPRKPDFDARLRKVEANRQNVLAYIMKQWRDLGQPKAAVFCQKDYHRWLEDKLPEGIVVDHFGNVAGTNDFADVGLEFIVGRALPGPRAVEIAASTLSGVQVATLVDPNPRVFSWYLSALGEIRLRDGGAASGRAHRHPDALADANLRSILSELQQALGRARPWGRDESKPLTVQLLLDEAIPSAIVDKVEHWPEVGPFDTLLPSGIVPTSEIDLMRLRPEIFTSVRTTRRYVKELQVPPDWQEFTYRPKGRRGRLSKGWHDPKLVNDPRAWLMEKVGPLSTFATVEKSL